MFALTDPMLRNLVKITATSIIIATAAMAITVEVGPLISLNILLISSLTSSDTKRDSLNSSNSGTNSSSNVPNATEAAIRAANDPTYIQQHTILYTSHTLKLQCNLLGGYIGR